MWRGLDGPTFSCTCKYSSEEGWMARLSRARVYKYIVRKTGSGWPWRRAPICMPAGRSTQGKKRTFFYACVHIVLCIVFNVGRRLLCTCVCGEGWMARLSRVRVYILVHRAGPAEEC